MQLEGPNAGAATEPNAGWDEAPKTVEMQPNSTCVLVYLLWYVVSEH